MMPSAIEGETGRLGSPKPLDPLHNPPSEDSDRTSRVASQKSRPGEHLGPRLRWRRNMFDFISLLPVGPAFWLPLSNHRQLSTSILLIQSWQPTQMSAGRWVANSAESVISTTACSSILSTPKAASTANSRLDLAEVTSTPESISASAKAAEMSGSRLPTIRFSISTEGGRGHRICHGHHQAGQGRRCDRGGVDPACGRQPRLQN